MNKTTLYEDLKDATIMIEALNKVKSLTGEQGLFVVKTIATDERLLGVNEWNAVETLIDKGIQFEDGVTKDSGLMESLPKMLDPYLRFLVAESFGDWRYTRLAFTLLPLLPPNIIRMWPLVRGIYRTNCVQMLQQLQLNPNFKEILSFGFALNVLKWVSDGDGLGDKGQSDIPLMFVRDESKDMAERISLADIGVQNSTGDELTSFLDAKNVLLQRCRKSMNLDGLPDSWVMEVLVDSKK